MNSLSNEINNIGLPSLLKCQTCHQQCKLYSEWKQHNETCSLLLMGPDWLGNTDKPIDPILGRVLLHYDAQIANLIALTTSQEIKIKSLTTELATRSRKKIADVLDRKQLPGPLGGVGWWDELANSVNLSDLELVLDFDLITAFQHVIMRTSKEGIPLCAFNERKNTVYGYDGNRWKILNLGDIRKLIYSKKSGGLKWAFIKQLVEWTNQNKERIESGDKKLGDRYFLAVSRLNEEPRDSQVHLMKHWLWKHLAKPLSWLEDD